MKKQTPILFGANAVILNSSKGVEPGIDLQGTATGRARFFVLDEKITQICREGYFKYSKHRRTQTLIRRFIEPLTNLFVLSDHAHYPPASCLVVIACLMS